jgi:GDPmannose 4,6-dehydratase
MWLMLQQDQPDDYVVGMGQTHSVQDFVDIAFGHAGLDWRKYVVVDPLFYRPAEVDLLLADSAKARRVLGWQPEVSFERLVKMMVDEDIKTLQAKHSGSRRAKAA